MESNKSKGVGGLIQLVSPDDIKMWYQLVRGFETTDRLYEEMAKHPAFAHPQQSDGVGQGCEAGCKTYTGGETKHHPDCRHYPNSMSERLNNSTSVSKPVGQAAEAKAKIIADVADEVLGKDFCREDVKDLADIYDKYFQPSEPAALKEFYCIGDKDNLFQCEEQCEDCKKGAALKDGEVESFADEFFNRNPAIFHDNDGHEFKCLLLCDLKEALKEFASLLTNHKS